jgi:hypothetical protein
MRYNCRMRHALLGLLLAACYSSPSRSYATQPAYSGQPPPGAPTTERAPWSCADLDRPGTHGSVCAATADGCERERGRAAAAGVTASVCRPQKPVACFQLGGDPSPGAEMCASTTEDCELLRQIDRDKHGQTGEPCAWRHEE